MRVLRFRAWVALASLSLPLTGALAITTGDDDTGGACERRLRSEPDGRTLACLEPSVPISVEERVPGWVRVRLEGWIPEGDATLFQSPGETASLSGSAVDAGGKPAAGATARLIAQSEDLDRALAALEQQSSADRGVLQERIDKLDKELGGALFSSDNLYEAKMTQLRLRDEKSEAERQIRALNERSAEELLRIFDRHTVGEITADASGFFLIEGVQPGSYRLLLISGAPLTGSAWYVPVKLLPGQRQRLNLSGVQELEDPFSSYR